MSLRAPISSTLRRITSRPAIPRGDARDFQSPRQKAARDRADEAIAAHVAARGRGTRRGCRRGSIVEAPFVVATPRRTSRAPAERRGRPADGRERHDARLVPDLHEGRPDPVPVVAHGRTQGLAGGRTREAVPARGTRGRDRVHAHRGLERVHAAVAHAQRPRPGVRRGVPEDPAAGLRGRPARSVPRRVRGGVRPELG